MDVSETAMREFERTKTEHLWFSTWTEEQGYFFSSFFLQFVRSSLVSRAFSTYFFPPYKRLGRKSFSMERYSCMNVGGGIEKFVENRMSTEL